MRVLGLRLQPHQVHDVDHPHFQVRQVRAEQVGGRQDFQGGGFPGAAEDDIRLVVGRAGPRPDSQPAGAVGDRFIHAQIGQRGLLAATMTFT